VKAAQGLLSLGPIRSRKSLPDNSPTDCRVQADPPSRPAESRQAITRATLRDGPPAEKPEKEANR
jgi:hypothetical protein